MVQGVELRWITSLASQLRRRSISTGRERERVARPELTGCYKHDGTTGHSGTPVESATHRRVARAQSSAPPPMPPRER
eukprot:scaffold63256_cov73-Phaeocystis_antarctica.AAC.4